MAPTLADLGLAELDDELLMWEQLRTGGQWFWELAAAFGSAHQRDRWREIALLFGSTAEAVRIAVTATVEIALLRSAMANRDLTSSYWLGVRFFAESQGQLTLGAGHRLANIVVRALMLDEAYPWSAVVPNMLRTPFLPFSDRKEHWVGMSAISHLTNVASAAAFPSVSTMAAIVRQLSLDVRWRRLEDQRGRDFHRAREESPVVARSPRSSAWSVDSGGTTLGLGPPAMPDPAIAEHAINEIAAISAAGLAALADQLQPFRLAWMTAIGEVSGGRLSFNPDDDRFHISSSDDRPADPT
jgi:hypothetical protein